MDLQITEKKEEPLLGRLKVTASLSFEATTPSNEEVRGQIASALNVDKKLVVVKKINSRFGERVGDALACVYYTEDTMKKLEKLGKKAREKIEKAEADKNKKAEVSETQKVSDDDQKSQISDKAKEAPKEESPKEEGKEEAKEEKKEEVKEEKPKEEEKAEEAPKEEEKKE